MNSLKRVWMIILPFCLFLFVMGYISNCREEHKRDSIARQKKLEQEEHLKDESFLLSLDKRKRAEVVLERYFLSDFKGTREENKNINLTWTPRGNFFEVEASIFVQPSLINGKPNIRSILLTTMKFAKNISKVKHVEVISRITIHFNYSGLNKYGNVTHANASTMKLDMSQIKQINWENMTIDLFEKLTVL